MSNWIDKDLVIWSIKRLKQDPWKDTYEHRIIVQACNDAIDTCIDLVKRTPTMAPCPEDWREKDE